jgi:hypothetical protein
MARHRTRVRVSRSLRAAAVGLAAAGGVTALFEADMGRSILLSSSTVALVPPALYLVLAFALLRGAPVGRRLGWAVAACGVNALLALASGVTLSLTHPMSFEGAMRRALWAFAPGPLIHLAAAPLVLLAWRSRVVPLRMTVRAEGGRGLPGSRVPALPLAAPTPDWDAVMRVSAPATWRPRSSPPVSERGARPHEVKPEPERAARAEPIPMAAAAVAVAPVVAPSTEIAAPPLVAMPSPPAPPPRPRTPLPPRLPSPAIASPAVAHVAAPEPVDVGMPTPPTDDGPVIRVPFDRIADQLPPDVFVLPPERLAESVREPHVIVVPCRLVLPQLGEGAVEIPWTLIDDQFPELALAMPKADVRRRFPGWVLSLPMDEVVRQIPADVFRLQAPAVDLLDIGQFPPPFKPELPAPEEAPSPEPMVEAELPVDAVREPARVVATDAVDVAPPPVQPVRVPADEIPSVVFSFAEPGAAPSPAPAAVAAPVTPAAPAMPVFDPTPVPAVAMESPGPVVAAARPGLAVTDDETEALGRTLALGLVPLGAFEWRVRRVDGCPLVSFVPPALPREPIDALAAAAAPLVERLASWGIEQVAIRTTRLVCVLTPLGARGCLAATVRRGGPVAMLEILSTRAGHAMGEAPSVASPDLAFPAVATTPARTDNGHRAVGEAARVLAAFGPLAMSVAEAEGGAPGMYVFGGQDQDVLAGAARAVHETLVVGHDHEALGRLESVTLRRGRERAVLRPLRGPGGMPAVLAAAGEVALVGRAHRAAAQAAALLEAR